MPRYDPELLTAHLAPVISETLVEYAGARLPRDFNVRLEHPEWPTTMLLSVVVDQERGPIASGLSNMRMGKWGEETTDVPTYRELASILAETVDVNEVLQRMAAEAAATVWLHAASQAAADDPGLEQASRDELFERSRKLRLESRTLADSLSMQITPKRRRTITRKHLQEVAACYRRALSEGLPPTQQVAIEFHTSHSTAARWVTKARAAGELGPATGPRPGEADA